MRTVRCPADVCRRVRPGQPDQPEPLAALDHSLGRCAVPAGLRHLGPATRATPARPGPFQRRPPFAPRRAARRPRRDAAQPTRLPGYRVADRQSGRAASRSRRIRRRRGQCFGLVVLRYRAGRRLAGSLAGTPRHLAYSRDTGSRHDVQRGLAAATWETSVAVPARGTRREGVALLPPLKAYAARLSLASEASQMSAQSVPAWRGTKTSTVRWMPAFFASRTRRWARM